MVICNLYEPASQVTEWLLEEVLPVALGLCLEQASFLSFYFLYPSYFLFLGSHLTLFLLSTDGDIGWGCGIAQGLGLAKDTECLSYLGGNPMMLMSWGS